MSIIQVAFYILLITYKTFPGYSDIVIYLVITSLLIIAFQLYITA